MKLPLVTKFKIETADEEVQRIAEGFEFIVVTGITIPLYVRLIAALHGEQTSKYTTVIGVKSPKSERPVIDRDCAAEELFPFYGLLQDNIMEHPTRDIALILHAHIVAKTKEKAMRLALAALHQAV